MCTTRLPAAAVERVVRFDKEGDAGGWEGCGAWKYSVRVVAVTVVVAISYWGVVGIDDGMFGQLSIARWVQVVGRVVEWAEKGESESWDTGFGLVVAAAVGSSAAGDAGAVGQCWCLFLI